MISFALRALPLSITESQVLIDEAANITSFAGRKESVNFIDITTVPHAFILKHIDKLIPSGVGDRFRKPMIPNHVSNSEVFNMYRLVIADKLSACLMKKIATLIRNFLMPHSKSMNCFTSGIRAFLLPGYRALKSFKPFLSLAEIFRAFHRFAVRSGEECLDAEVNADFIASIFRLRYFNFAKNRGIVSTRRRLGYSNGLHCSLNRSMKDDLDPLAFGDIESPSADRPMLRGSKRLLVSFLLEVREFGSFVEEVVISNVQVSKGLLQRLGIGFFKPLKFGYLFELRQRL